MDKHRETNLRTLDFRRSSVALRSLPSGHDEARSVSLTTVVGVVRVLDALGVLIAGAATAFRVMPPPLPSPYSVILFVILATIIMMNVAHFLGAYQHKALFSSTTSIGTALFGSSPLKT